MRDVGIDNITPDVRPGAPSEWDDEFSDGALDGKWTWVNQDDATYTERDGAGIITVPQHSGDSLRMLVQDKPSGDFTVTVKFSWRATLINYRFAGLVVTDGTKVISWGLGHNSTYKLLLNYWTNPTTWSADSASASDLFDFDQVILRIVDDGSNLKFYFSQDDGVIYTLATTKSRTEHLTPSKIGIVVNNNHGSSGDVIMAARWFRVTED